MRKLALLVLLVACDSPTAPPDGVDVYSGVIDSAPYVVVADIDPWRPITECVIDGTRREWKSSPYMQPPGVPYCGRFYHEAPTANGIRPVYDITIEEAPEGASYRVTLGKRPEGVGPG